MKNKQLKEIIDNISGKLVTIGMEEEYLINAISNNKKITYCDLLNSPQYDKTKHLFSLRKTISIRKLKKKYKKKNLDYMIINYNHVKFYLKSFVKNSIYITNKILYFYNLDLDEALKIKKRYERYNISVELIKTGSSYIVKIYVNDTKTSIFKNIIYYFIDTFSDIVYYLEEFLVN